MPAPGRAIPVFGFQCTKSRVLARRVRAGTLDGIPRSPYLFFFSSFRRRKHAADDELSIESGRGACTDLLILVLFYQDQRVPVYNDVSWLTIILQHLCVKHEIY